MKTQASVAPAPDSAHKTPTQSQRILAAEEQAGECFDELLSLVQDSALRENRELHEVERGVFEQLLRLGKTLVELFVAEKGPGRVGEGEAISPAGVALPYHSLKVRTSYLSIFGSIAIPRAYYWKPGAEKGWCPLDAELNLPEQRYSYLLQEWGTLLGVDGSFEKVTARLETLLGVKLWGQGVRTVSSSAGSSVQDFYEQKPPPNPSEEGELLVATLDGKGVPIRPAEPRERRLRLRSGEKPNKKKEAVVSAVYSVDRYVRTPDDVIREISDLGFVVKPDPAPPPRPRPQGKRVRATLLGKDAAFAEARRQLDERDPLGIARRVALTDGAAPLQERVLRDLAEPGGIVLILDLMHVLTYLWAAANVDHAEGSTEASRWVMRKLRLLLEGKVGYVIGGLRRRLREPKGLNKTKRKALNKAISYFARNRDYMAYDTYLAEGYPIGSGVVEGACKHLVKDRMELTGMRWSEPGAQAVLELRAVELNGDWRDFWVFHARTQRERLYGVKQEGVNVRRSAA